MPMIATAEPIAMNSARRSLWICILVLANILFSWGFACAAPFAAYAAAAALTLTRRDALTLMVAVWAVNQAVGFVLLDYPTDAISLAWGAMLLVAAVAAILVAQLCAARLGDMAGIARAAATLVAAFVAYEVALVIATPALGGIASFAPGIVGEVFALNAFGFMGLFALTRIGAMAGVAPRWRLARVAA